MIEASDRGIRSIHFADEKQQDSHAPNGDLRGCAEQLRAYFDRKQQRFHGFRLAMLGTDFEQRVWDAAMAIPFGETVTYAEIAEIIGQPGAARAVGNALGANPLLLVVPCHRVVPSAGGIGGFAAEAWRKEWLLAFERASP